MKRLLLVALLIAGCSRRDEEFSAKLDGLRDKSCEQEKRIHALERESENYQYKGSLEIFNTWQLAKSCQEGKKTFWLKAKCPDVWRIEK